MYMSDVTPTGEYEKPAQLEFNALDICTVYYYLPLLSDNSDRECDNATGALALKKISTKLSTIV